MIIHRRLPQLTLARLLILEAVNSPRQNIFFLPPKRNFIVKAYQHAVSICSLADCSCLDVAEQALQVTESECYIAELVRHAKFEAPKFGLEVDEVVNQAFNETNGRFPASFDPSRGISRRTYIGGMVRRIAKNMIHRGWPARHQSGMDMQSLLDEHFVATSSEHEMAAELEERKKSVSKAVRPESDDELRLKAVLRNDVIIAAAARELGMKANSLLRWYHNFIARAKDAAEDG